MVSTCTGLGKVKHFLELKNCLRVVFKRLKSRAFLEVNFLALFWERQSSKYSSSVTGLPLIVKSSIKSLIVITKAGNPLVNSTMSPSSKREEEIGTHHTIADYEVPST